MGWFGRTLGNERPRLPAGSEAFVAMDTAEPPNWTIRSALPGEDHTTDRPRVEHSPTFTSLVEASKFADWVNGGEQYRYPSGKV